MPAGPDPSSTAPAVVAWRPPPGSEVRRRLHDHLRSWLGHWPPRAPVELVTSPARSAPGWDGRPSALVGVRAPEGSVLSVEPAALERLGGPQTAESLESVRSDLLEALGFPHGRLFEGVFRWTDSPALIPEVGRWVSSADRRVAQWLRPFGGEVLVAFVDGKYAAGVGMKRHDDRCWELAVGTEEQFRGRRLARSLVAQAARRVLDDGRVPTYLHGLGNDASAAVADAAGFPDRGWRIVGVLPS